MRATERGIHLTLSTEGAPEELSAADKTFWFSGSGQRGCSVEEPSGNRDKAESTGRGCDSGPAPESLVGGPAGQWKVSHLSLFQFLT